MRTSFFLIGFLIISAPLAYAADLININIADAALLDTLPGVGPTIAGRIIDYRTANGPFAAIEDLQKVSGIGSGSTYAKIAPLITVGDAPTPATPSSESATTSEPIVSAGTSTYAPPPATISLQINGTNVALLEVPLHLSARVVTKGGAVDQGAKIIWTFGDGSSGEGRVIEKTYRYPGTYVVSVVASDGDAMAHDERIVTVTSARVHLLPVSNEGITIVNDLPDRLDLSGWRLRSDTGLFRIPDGTILLPGASTLFPFLITNLPLATDPTLLFPDGMVAGVVMQSMPVQPAQESVSYKEVQAVEPIISTRTIVQSHAQAAVAPAASTELAAAGAPMLLAATGTSAAPAKPRSPGLLRSPWTIGLLGVVALAGGAFILL